MASAVYSETQAHADRRRLSLRIDSPASSSPFPSPSSSFLPPPTPGAHEFAVKPPPAGRNGRKASFVQKQDEPVPMLNSQPPQTNGTSPLADAMSPVTPTPSTSQRQSVSTNGTSSLPPPLLPPSPSLMMTPTAAASTFPESHQRASTAPTAKIPTTPSSLSFYNPPSPSVQLFNGSPVADSPSSSLASSRPAPPSPSVSRRVSAAPSTSSVRSKSSRSSRPPSVAVSRTNSTRKINGTGAGTNTNISMSSSSPVANRLSSQLGTSVHHAPSSPMHSPQSSSFSFIPRSSTATAPMVVTSTPKHTIFVHVRDFAFPSEDDRHAGLGADVPRANKVARLNRALRGRRSGSISSVESSDEEEDEMEEDDGGWGSLIDGRIILNRGSSSGAADSVPGGFPSRLELDGNFLRDGDGTEDDDLMEDFYDPEGEGDDGFGGEEEEPLYPGLYRALYTFEPEGTAEMALEEDQVVRVVGRGGGVGWAVVIDEREGMADKHALVPESYLEVFRLDWEGGEEAPAEN